MDTRPKTIPFGSPPLTEPMTVPFRDNSIEQIPVSLKSRSDILDGFANAINAIFPGKQVGQSIGTLAGLGIEKAKGLLGGKDNSATYDTSAPSPMQVAGDIASGAVSVAGLKLPVPSSLLGSAAQLGGLSAVQGAGSKLSEGGGIGEAIEQGAISGAIGAVAGGAFNLLGKGISTLAEKTTPAVLSFTSGVPKDAISQAIKFPEVSGQGIGMSVAQVREKAIGSLTSLRTDLGNEFGNGLAAIKQSVPVINDPAVIDEVKDGLINSGKNLAREYRVSFAKGLVDFSKSNIVNSSEQKNIVATIDTLKSWKDFSPQGVQDLAERIGALRNFESGITTKASAVVGQIYNDIAGEKGVIAKLYPELKELRTNFAVNKKVLDEIGNVLSEGKNKPTQIQTSVTRLDNLFRQNRDEYVNAIKQLADRSGVDFVSLLAGGEFQKVLPGFVRGLGGGGAVAVGTQLLNPWLILLAPLFSPRAVGSIIQNAPSVARTASQVLQATSAKVIPKLRQ